MIVGGRRDRPHAARQQQRLVPGQRDLVARLGARRAERTELREFTRRLLALRREHPIFHRTQFLHGSGSPLRPARRLVVPARRPAHERADWQDAGARALGVFLNGKGIGSLDAQGEPIVDSLVPAAPQRAPRGHRVLAAAAPLRAALAGRAVDRLPATPGDLLTARGSAHVTARSLLLLRQPDPKSPA